MLSTNTVPWRSTCDGTLVGRALIRVQEASNFVATCFNEHWSANRTPDGSFNLKKKPTPTNLCAFRTCLFFLQSTAPPIAEARYLHWHSSRSGTAIQPRPRNKIPLLEDIHSGTSLVNNSEPTEIVNVLYEICENPPNIFGAERRFLGDVSFLIANGYIQEEAITGNRLSKTVQRYLEHLSIAPVTIEGGRCQARNLWK